MSQSTKGRLIHISNQHGYTPSERAYQRYYELSIASRWPLAIFSGFAPQSSFIRYLSNIAYRSTNFFRTLHPTYGSHTSIYTIDCPSGATRFAIDASDSGELEAPHVTNKVHIYFKSNYWQSKDYPLVVRPIVNGNSNLTPRRLNRLSQLRSAPKHYDVVFISRVWGGIEHNVRCFETLNQIPGNNLLIALFTPQSASHDSDYEIQKRDARKRLERIGIRCLVGQIPLLKLWQLLAAGRIVFLRAGKHLCIPWRMLDLLAMGSVIVTDSVPYPTWPIPLTNELHYESLKIERPINTDAAPLDNYENARDVIDSLLLDKARRDLLASNAANYFDTYASPQSVGKYIKKCIQQSPIS